MQLFQTIYGNRVCLINFVILSFFVGSFALERLVSRTENKKNIHSSTNDYVNDSNNRRPLTIVDNLVFVSTLDGLLQALEPTTGVIKWVLQEEPVLKVPNTVQSGFTFLPDPQDGSLYLLGEGRLKKFPFTIPQLVQASPCKSSDGVLYAGNKKDVWFAIDPKTGRRIETLSQDTTDKYCPASDQKTVFIGRTEYQLSMFDSNSRTKRWNATFTDYSSHVLPEDTTYSLQHFSSSSDGRLLTVDSDSGDILWNKNFGSPIVAMYILQGNGLHRLPFTVIGKETLDSLLEDSQTSSTSHPWVKQFLSTPPEADVTKTLYPTLYVGETLHGLYALPSYVDEKTVTIAPKYLGPPLLEGPMPIAQEVQPPNPPPTRPQITIDDGMAKMTHKTVDGEFLLLGYHETPSIVRLNIEFMKEPGLRKLPSITFEPQLPLPSNTNQPIVEPQQTSFLQLLLAIWRHHPKIVGTSGITLVTLVLFLVWIFAKQRFPSPKMAEPRSAQTSRIFQHWTSDEVPIGWFVIGKMLYNPSNVLGRGCEGTVVYKGIFDGRQVAVKRVVLDFLNLADREVAHLKESDMHSNVIRYYCMESDSQFRYIALELCTATLQDYVNDENLRNKCPLSTTVILEQAAAGLAHLHSLKIVHRDIKPQNVLLSLPDSKSRVRILISDFGMCKKLAFGRNSLSRRSGITGTDGWIAPEALNSEASIMCAVDIFPLGCVFYYMLTLGCHPFGDNWRRQANILAGEYSMKELSTISDDALGPSLIESMICPDAAKRPSTSAVLKHPFFWTKHKTLSFFQDVSDRVEKEDQNSPVLWKLEKDCRKIVRNDWRKIICPTLQADLRKFRTYRGNSVRDLLRAMRNKKHHYRELPQDLRQSFGTIPDQFVTYFTSRFPQLVLHVYKAMECVKSEDVFIGYYEQDIVRNSTEESII